MNTITDLIQNLFGSGASNNTNLVPETPNMLSTPITTTTPTAFNTGGVTDALGSLSGFQIGQLGLGLGSGLLNGYLGFSNLNESKKQAKQAQSNWNKQWSANVKNTNAALSDRQAARVASNPNAYESVDSYMKKYGIS